MKKEVSNKSYTVGNWKDLIKEKSSMILKELKNRNQKKTKVNKNWAMLRKK